jgi:hypothetical protein
VADLVETASPLDVGLKGRFEGVPFDLVGRTQFKHPAGGVWDEWYAAFSDGRWGWLAEAQGRFYMTFETPVPENLPGYDTLELGQKVTVGDGLKLLVAEKNRGQTSSARGEIPYRVIPGEELPFADLSGPKGEFGTIDYSGDAPTMYVGRQVTLDELHIPPGQRRKYPGQEPRIEAVHLNCPKCGAALDLRAPDKSERVGCASCGSLSDVKGGKLQLFRSLDPPPTQPILPLGAVGKRDGIEWTVVGFMQRYVTVEGVDYFWEEYLLYQPRLGFRWLTRSDEHWNWVEALPPGSVTVDGNVAYYADRWYRLFQRAKAKVSFVIGEFYWKVQAGETVSSNDYVNAPGILSEEVTREGDEGEINWSYGHYLTRAEVQEMFGLKQMLPTSWVIAPNQPFPHSGIYKSALLFLAVGLLLGMLFWLFSPRREVYSETQQLPPLKDNARVHKFIIEEPLDVQGRKNLRIVLKPRGDAGWIHIKGSIVPAAAAPTPGSTTRTSTERREFSFMAQSAQQAYVYLSALPGGSYTLQYDLIARNPALPTSADVRVEQGVPHLAGLWCVLLILGGIPLLVAMYQIYWESRRWADSNIS